VRRSGDGSRVLERLTSPLIGFPALWLLSVALAQIHVLRIQTTFSATAWIVMAVVPVAFLGGALGVKAVIDRRVTAVPARGGAVSHRKLLIGLVIVGFAELIREYATAGTIPLLSAHIDAARVSIHPGALGLLDDCLTVAVIVAMTTPRRLFARAALPELVIAIVALGGSALSGGRQAFAVALAAGVARVLFWGPPRLRSTLITGLVGIALFGLVFYFRTGQELGQPFTDEIYGHAVPGAFPALVPFIPAFFALALNPVVLAHVIAYFPHSMAFGNGAYDAGAIHSLVHSLSLGSVTARLTPPWLVATAAGPLWADGGMPVVIGGFLIIGLITSAPYALYRRTQRFSHVVLAGYLTSLALYCVYDNLLTEYKDWVFVCVGLLVVGRCCETAARDESAPPDTGSASRTPIAVAGIAVIVALALVAVVAHRDVDRSRIAARTQSGITPIPEALPHTKQLSPDIAELSLSVPGAARRLLGDRLAAYAGPGLAPTVWAFSAAGARLLATPMAIDARAVKVGQGVLVAGPRPAGPVVYDVGRWGPSGASALFELTQRHNVLLTRIVSLTAPSHLLDQTRTALGAPPAGARRTFALVSSTRTKTDLVVVDRGATDRRILVQTYSSASGFTIARSYIGPRQGTGFPSDRWQLMIGPAESLGPDLVLVGDGSQLASAPLELHVLLSASGFRSFGDQTDIGTTVGAARSLRFVLGRRSDYYVVYAINPSRGTIVELIYD
jgi:hypothetical protein